MATNRTRIAPRILTDALTALLDQLDQAAPPAEQLDDTLLDAYALLWRGVELERRGALYIFTINGQPHQVNGACSCGQRCAGRVAKQLLQLAALQTPPARSHHGYPCVHCGATLLANHTPAGEPAYSCPNCCWTVSAPTIGATMLANGLCAHCGRRLESTDAGPLDMIVHACPDPMCPGYRDYY